MTIFRRLSALVAGGTLSLAAMSPVPAPADDGSEPSFLGKVVANATYEMETVATVFSEDPTKQDAEDDHLEAWTHLSLASDTFLGDDWSFGLGVEALASTYHGGERGVLSLPRNETGQARYVDLSRLTLTYLGDNADVMAGKDDIPVGVAELYSPTDIYGRQNSAHPQHMIDYGVWQLRGDYYLERDRLTAIILPVEEYAPGPADSSRWSGSGSSGLSEFASVNIPGLAPGVTADIKDELRGVSPGEWGYLFQYKGTEGRFDFFATGFNGPGPYPVLKAPPVGQVNPYDKVHPRVSIASGGLAFTEGPWKLYGETLSYVAQSNSDDDFSRALAGAKYRETRMANRIGLDEIAPVIKFSRELIHDDQDNAEYAVSSKEARLNPHNVIMSLTVTADSEWKFGGAYNHSIRDQDSLASAFIRYEPNDNLWMSLSAYDYDGRDGTLFGRFRRNDNVEFKLNYSF